MNKVFIVETPVRGVHTYLVQAKTAAEAMRKVNDVIEGKSDACLSDDDSDVQGVDTTIRHVGRARNAHIDCAR